MKLYVGNLTYSVTQDDLRDLFVQFGDVSSATLITDKFSGESKGFGFVEMEDNAAKDAIANLDGKDHMGRNLKVNEARPRAPR